MTNKFPKISIVTPSYNQGQYLEETILSVIGQNYQNLEYIIIDGGSSDNSIEIIKKYQKYLTYWVSEPDNGNYHALQKGFEKSSGELMAWINSDDKYHSSAFSIVSEIFSKYDEINWLIGSGSNYDEKGRTINVGNPKNWSKYDYYIGNYMWVQQESTFWRRKLWEKAGSKLELSIKYAADFELWLRFFRYEKLYTTTGLIGGFRTRSKEQISLDHFDTYLDEIEKLLAYEVITDSEKKIIKRYKIFKKSIELLNIFGIKTITNLGLDLLDNIFRRKYFDLPPRIIFDRTLQEFVILK
jgi:glycosyltransferase involved in cell wall biosynthesis